MSGRAGGGFGLATSGCFPDFPLVSLASGAPSAALLGGCFEQPGIAMAAASEMLMTTWRTSRVIDATHVRTGEQGAKPTELQISRGPRNRSTDTTRSQHNRRLLNRRSIHRCPRLSHPLARLPER